MLVTFLGIGFSLLIPSALWMTLYDHRSTSKRLCFQQSIEVADIFQAYEVQLFMSQFVKMLQFNNLEHKEIVEEIYALA